MEKLTIAIAKGRILKDFIPLLKKAGFSTNQLEDPGRQLIIEEGDYRFMIIRASDVPTYVEYGAAHLGIVGKDTLLEGDYELFELLDLGIGICRISVATAGGRELPPSGVIKIATKYPNITKSYFAEKGRQVEIIKLYGSMEIAPLVGLADGIVDLVSTGRTLQENGLAEVEVIEEYISSYLVANRKYFYLMNKEISSFVKKIKEVLNGEGK